MDVPRAYRNKMALVVDAARRRRRSASTGCARTTSCRSTIVRSSSRRSTRRSATCGAPRASPTAREAFAGARHVVMRAAPSSGEERRRRPPTRRSREVVASGGAGAGGGAAGRRRHHQLVRAGQRKRGDRPARGRVFGRAEIEETIDGLRFRVSPASFFQINGGWSSEIFALLRPLVRPGSAIVDLYCGAGTFALFFAARGATVVGIEENPYAVREARANAELNGVDERVRFVAGRVERSLANGEAGARRPARRGGRVPRSAAQGQRRGDARGARRGARPAIWYLSCNPATLARDLAQLTARGYALGDGAAVRHVPADRPRRDAGRGCGWSPPHRPVAGRPTPLSEKGRSMPSSSIDVRYVAKLARIALTDDEVATLRRATRRPARARRGARSSCRRPTSRRRRR